MAGAGVLFGTALACAGASAASFDPLRAAPGVLDKGVTLPGDARAAACPLSDDLAGPLSLSAAVDFALCDNPRIHAAWANIKISANAVGEARAAYLPTLSAALGRTSQSTRYGGGYAPVTTQDNTVSANLAWRLFDFGARAANRQAAENLLSAALASHEATLQASLGEVIQAYFDAYTARAAVESKTQIEAIAGGTLASARKREEKGLASQSDTLQARTALARASLDLNRAQGDFRKANAVLLYSMGLPVDTRITLPVTLKENTRQADQDLRGWLSITEQQHPAIMAARAQLDAARNKVAAIRSEGLPTLDLSVNYYRNGRPGQALTPTSHENTLSLVLTVPLFDGFSKSYKVRGAQAQVEQKEAELADTEHRILMDVVKVHADAQSALQNLWVSDELLLAARGALAVSQRKYDKGAADILELLNTQSALADAERESVRCMADWRAARLKLLANAGRMGRSALENEALGSH